MSRISKSAAKSMATSLLLPKKELIEKQEADLGDLAVRLVKNTIPKVVLEAFSERPEYFKKYTSVYVTGHGFVGEYVSLSDQVPLTGNYITLNPNDSNLLRYHVDKLDEAKADHRKLQLEVETALIGLKTYDAVRKAFPEAAEFIPSNMTTAVAVNLDDVRKKINSI